MQEQDTCCWGRLTAYEGNDSVVSYFKWLPVGKNPLDCSSASAITEEEKRVWLATWERLPWLDKPPTVEPVRIYNAKANVWHLCAKEMPAAKGVYLALVKSGLNYCKFDPEVVVFSPTTSDYIWSINNSGEELEEDEVVYWMSLPLEPAIDNGDEDRQETVARVGKTIKEMKRLVDAIMAKLLEL